MVCERIILFGVKNLQQSAGRVSIIRSRQLVHLVQHHDGIGCTAFLDTVHDPPRHCADIGSAVAANIRFIPDTPKADPHILPLQRMGNAAADACFPGTGRTDKQENGTGLFAFQIHHGNLLYDAALDLLQTVMVGLQDFTRLFQIDHFGFRLFPVQGSHEVQIVVQHTVLRRLVALLLQSVQDFYGFRPCGFVHPGFFDFHFEFPDIGNLFRVHFIQFPLQKFQLLFDG